MSANSTIDCTRGSTSFNLGLSLQNWCPTINFSCLLFGQHYLTQTPSNFFEIAGPNHSYIPVEEWHFGKLDPHCPSLRTPDSIPTAQNPKRGYRDCWFTFPQRNLLGFRSVLFKQSMSKRVLCKFFAHGACLKGDHCEFSHDWKDPPNNVCTFYQKGACSYGSRCRYEHVKVSRSQSSTTSSSASSHQFLVSDYASLNRPSGTMPVGSTAVPGIASELSASSKPFVPPAAPAWGQTSGQQSLLDTNDVFESRIIDPTDRSICSFAAAGSCPRGEKCPHIHGDLCPTCGKECLHPYRPQEREEHIKTCEKKQKHLEALKHSQEIECSVCLERVLSKLTAAERKFGLLSECDHPFCISCIRNWRSSSPSSGMDVNSTLRACPICRKVSYFVIPSVIWYSTREEKQEIVESYKSKLRSIDCKHFDFGNGSCPFGTSCFYKHAYRDGRLEEVVLRHLGAEDGHTVIAKNIRLSDFLNSLRIR